MGANTDACGVPGPVLRQADGDRSGLYWTRDGTPNPDARRFPVGTTSNPTLLVNAVTLDQLVPASGLCATVSQSPPGGILLNCCFLFPRWLSAQYPRGASIGAASSTLIVKHGIPAHQWLGHQWCKGTEDSPTRGIPMALSGTQTAVRVCWRHRPTRWRWARTGFSSRFARLRWRWRTGVPTAKFQATLYPAPLQMAVEGQAHLVLTVFPEPADALALGAAKVKTGTDVELKPWGLGMCVAGQATATQAQPQPSVTYQVPAARAMRFGAAAIELPSIVLRPQGSDALRMGRARLVQVAKAPSQAMALGQPRTVQIVKPASGCPDSGAAEHPQACGRRHPAGRGWRAFRQAGADGGAGRVGRCPAAWPSRPAGLRLPCARACPGAGRPTVARTHQC
jgi:hypothetical protein